LIKKSPFTTANYFQRWPTPLDTALMFSTLKETTDDPNIQEALDHETGSEDLQTKF